MLPTGSRQRLPRLLKKKEPKRMIWAVRQRAQKWQKPLLRNYNFSRTKSQDSSIGMTEYGCNGDYILGTKNYEEKHTAEDMVDKKITVIYFVHLRNRFNRRLK